MLLADPDFADMLMMKPKGIEIFQHDLMRSDKDSSTKKATGVTAADLAQEGGKRANKTYISV